MILFRAILVILLLALPGCGTGLSSELPEVIADAGTDDPDPDTDPDPGADDSDPDPVEVCETPGDEDADGDADCADSECALEAYCDADADGYVDEAKGGDDCDDSEAGINLMAAETCDGLDENCDGQVDEGGVCAPAPPEDCDQAGDEDSDGDADCADSDCAGTPSCDADADGFIDQAQGGDDCNDADAAINPGASEEDINLCSNAVDEDCSGADLDCIDWDKDGDGFNENQGDCDETDAQIYPGQTETCNEIDDDCNGRADEIDACGYHGMVLADDPVAYFRLNEEASGAVADSLNNHPGTSTAQVVFEVAGSASAKAFEFGANGARVTFPNLDQENLSIELWFKRTLLNSPEEQIMVGSTNGGFALGFPGARAYFDPSQFNRPLLTKVGAGYAQSDSTILSDCWHHYVVTMDNTDTCFYLNGALDNCTPYSPSFNSSGGLYSIGALPGGGSRFYGALDEVAFYSAPLDPSRITAHYNAGSSIGICDPLPDNCFDADGDGFESNLCGGDDCDDENAFIVPNSAECGGPGVPEDCENGFDDDSDGDTDCDDSDCNAELSCAETDCSNAADDDSDGDTDCDDSDCTLAPECAETDCGNASDDDGDALTDCDDPDCEVALECQESDCENGMDDDNDGGLDCDDSDCSADPACTEPVEVDCTDAQDNDGDTKIDCEDEDCLGGNGCPSEQCTNGIDDELDGDIDCIDSECIGHPSCTDVEECDNNVDDDSDGDEDCDDSDCFGTPECNTENNCSNGNDEDNDGFTDCDDSDCDPSPFCNPETDCDDDVDNDGDENIDCGDPDCNDNPSCVENCFNGFDDDDNGDVDCDDDSCIWTNYCIHSCFAPDNDGDGYDRDECGGGDCDDNDENFNPGAPDYGGQYAMNGLDENCDGLADNGPDHPCESTDNDQDGFDTCPGSVQEDCDDNDPEIGNNDC